MYLPASFTELLSYRLRSVTGGQPGCGSLGEKKISQSQQWLKRSAELWCDVMEATEACHPPSVASATLCHLSSMAFVPVRTKLERCSVSLAGVKVTNPVSVAFIFIAGSTRVLDTDTKCPVVRAPVREGDLKLLNNSFLV